MRAISVHYQHAQAIVQGLKLEEYRSWKIALGDILVCSAQRKPSAEELEDYGKDKIPAPSKTDLGAMIAVVEIWRVEGAKSQEYTWYLRNVRPCKRVQVKGAQGVYRVPDERIAYLGNSGAPHSLEAPLTRLREALGAEPLKTAGVLPVRRQDGTYHNKQLTELVNRAENTAKTLAVELQRARERMRILGIL